MKLNGATQRISLHSFLHFGLWLSVPSWLCQDGLLLVNCSNSHIKFLPSWTQLEKICMDLLRPRERIVLIVTLDLDLGFLRLTLPLFTLAYTFVCMFPCHTHPHLCVIESHDLRHPPAVSLSHSHKHKHTHTLILKFRLIHLGGPVCLAAVWGLDQRLDWQNTHTTGGSQGCVLVWVCVCERERETGNLGVCTYICLCISFVSAA